MLEKILQNVNAINVSLKRQVPIFIKIAPDLNENNVTEILNVCEENNVSGLIATNTTISLLSYWLRLDQTHYFLHTH